MARQIAVEVYKLTSDFPASEKFGLTNQLRRAAISISSNIAEGSSRRNSKDRRRFIEMGYGSLLEVLSQLIISRDLGYINDANLSHIRPEIEKLSNKMNAYKNAISE